MLHLQEDQLIGRGTERCCYRHPQDATRCIKVTHNFKNNKQQNLKDYEYFTSLQKRGIDWSYLPHCYGWVETDQGNGLVFDLLQDKQGTPLPRLDILLRDGRLDKTMIKTPLEELRNYLRANQIFTSDLRASNVVCDLRKTSLHFFVVDGIGDRDFIRVASVIIPLSSAKIDRQWKRFIRRMEKQK